MSHWHVGLVGHVSPNSSEYWNGFEGFAYPQFLQIYNTDPTISPITAISPDTTRDDELDVPAGYQSLPIEQERSVSSKTEMVKLDSLIEPDNIYSPLVAKRTYNKTGLYAITLLYHFYCADYTLV